MKDLNLLLIQFDIAWRDASANMSKLDTLLSDADPEWADLIVLPETFSSGFTMHPEGVYQTMNGPVVEWMATLAKDKNATVMGSVVLQDDEAFFNRLLSTHPDGSLTYYDKRHLFSFAGEDKVFTPGKHRLTTVCGDGWKICPLICYDLRFPVWSRNTDDYDVLLYVANWPSARVDAWNALLKARAIENQSYAIGVNRTGSDENGIHYPGSTRAYDMGGDLLVSSETKTDVLRVTLNHETLTEYRAKYNFLPDRDRFMIV